MAFECLSLYREYREMVLMNLFAGSNGDADVENRLVNTVRGRRGRDKQSSLEIYTLPCAK